MIYLLDVNLLIAILDPHHVHHERAHTWFGPGQSYQDWASCPLTENAYVRITGASTYPNSLGSAAIARDLLEKNCSGKEHHFWADDISLCQGDLFRESMNVQSSQITDIYLLALAVKNGGTLASFDRHIPSHLVNGGKKALLLLST